MPRGKQTRALRPDQIARLVKFKKEPHLGAPHGYSYPQLRTAMAANFRWETLKKALGGHPVWDLHQSWIAQWIERYLPAAPAPIDGKSAASGERDEAAASGERSSEEAASTTQPAPSSSQRNAGRSSGDAASEEVAAAGKAGRGESSDESDEEEAGATGTVRGSR